MALFVGDPRRPMPHQGLGDTCVIHRGDLNVWAIADTLRQRPSAIFTDIDGTISPIVPVPGDARVTPECREALSALVRHVDLLCVMTGRPADEAWRMVGIDDALYVGNHGAERWLRGELLRPSGVERFHARLARAQAMLRHALADVPGLVFEDKGIGFAVHFREQREAGARVIRQARDVARRRGLEVIERTAHVEVRAPIPGDKGTSLRAIAMSYGLRGVVVLGDDRVDLPMFAAARDHAASLGGASVVVSVGASDDLAATEPDIVLATPAETCGLLHAVAETLAS